MKTDLLEESGGPLLKRSVIGLLLISFLATGCLFGPSTSDSDQQPPDASSPDISSPVDTGPDAATDTEPGSDGDVAPDGADSGDVDPTPPAYPQFLRLNAGTESNATSSSYRLHFTVESGVGGKKMSSDSYNLQLTPVPRPAGRAPGSTGE